MKKDVSSDIQHEQMDKKILLRRQRVLEILTKSGRGGLPCEDCKAGPGRWCKYKIFTWHECRVKHFTELCEELGDINNKINILRQEDNEKREAKEADELIRLVEEDINFQTDKRREIRVTYIHEGHFKIIQTENTINLYAGMIIPGGLLSLIAGSTINAITI